MKKIILALSALLIFNFSQAQVIEKDTVMLDSTQVEKINKMPMDSAIHTMPVAPLESDSIRRRSIDDADPKRPKTPRQKKT